MLDQERIKLLCEPMNESALFAFALTSVSLLLVVLDLVCIYRGEAPGPGLVLSLFLTVSAVEPRSRCAGHSGMKTP